MQSESKKLTRLRALLVRARHELACLRCGNNSLGVSAGGSVTNRMECPECHGEFRNPDTIALLTALVEHEQ
jgi:hypothetical protein